MCTEHAWRLAGKQRSHKFMAVQSSAFRLRAASAATIASITNIPSSMVTSTIDVTIMFDIIVTSITHISSSMITSATVITIMFDIRVTTTVLVKVRQDML